MGTMFFLSFLSPTFGALISFSYLTRNIMHVYGTQIRLNFYSKICKKKLKVYSIIFLFLLTKHKNSMPIILHWIYISTIMCLSLCCMVYESSIRIYIYTRKCYKLLNNMPTNQSIYSDFILNSSQFCSPDIIYVMQSRKKS